MLNLQSSPITTSKMPASQIHSEKPEVPTETASFGMS